MVVSAVFGSQEVPPAWSSNCFGFQLKLPYPTNSSKKKIKWEHTWFLFNDLDENCLFLAFLSNLYEPFCFGNCQHFRDLSLTTEYLPPLEQCGRPTSGVTWVCWSRRSTSLPAGAIGCPRCCCTGGGPPPLCCRACCMQCSPRLSGCKTGQSPPRTCPDPSSPVVFARPFQKTEKPQSVIWELSGILQLGFKSTRAPCTIEDSSGSS